MIVKKNPIDYYNSNRLEEALEVFLNSSDNINKIDESSYTYMKTKADTYSKMFIVEGNKLVVAMDNALDIPKGTHMTPFDILMNFKHKGRFEPALNDVNFNTLGYKIPIFRVGTKFFKQIIEKDRYGQKRFKMKLWDKNLLKDDYSIEAISRIPKYDDFTIEPNNHDYQAIIGSNYNLYSPFPYKPKEGEWVWIDKLIRHIFGEHYELGLIYMQVMYMLPKQALPILVLTSTERQTGKSTFVDFLTMLFGSNSAIINPEDISSGFNAAYANKNVICIEESRFESVAATEKLKNLATQKYIMFRDLYMSPVSIPFFGKLIITSNDEKKFSRIDNTEIRYWVRKVPSLKGIANHRIHEDLIKEIPAFLHYLSQMPEVDLTKSRMVFTEDQIRTEALDTVKQESKSWLMKDLEIKFDEFMIKNPDHEFFEFTTSELKDFFFSHNNKVDTNYLHKVLKDELELEKQKTKRYTPINEINTIGMNAKIPGRPFIIKNKYFNNGKSKKFNIQHT